jgi:hypothetical protein
MGSREGARVRCVATGALFAHVYAFIVIIFVIVSFRKRKIQKRKKQKQRKIRVVTKSSEDLHVTCLPGELCQLHISLSSSTNYYDQSISTRVVEETHFPFVTCALARPDLNYTPILECSRV